MSAVDTDAVQPGNGLEQRERSLPEAAAEVEDQAVLGPVGSNPKHAD